MRFKNFINNFSKRNRIFSDEDMYNMSLGNLFDNEDELYSQYQSIGFPNRIELETSPNVQWVEPYTTTQGQQEGGFFQSILEPDYQTPVGSVLQQSLPQIAGFDNKNDIFNLTNILQGQNGIKPDFELGVEKNVFAEPQTNAAQTRPIFPQITQKVSDIQNQNAQNANISGINQDELGSILERMLKLPYLNNADTKRYDFSSQNKDGLSVLGQGNELLNKILDGVDSQINKAKNDYDGLTPIEKAQKWTSKHASGWVPSEYYGISDYLADDGEMPDKYKKNNDHYKLGGIEDERTKEIITAKVQQARKDSPVGPYVNTPLEDVDVIVPKDDSDLVKEVKRSDEIAEFIERNKEKLQAGETVSGSIEFGRPQKLKSKDVLIHPIVSNEEIGRFAAIHKADVVDAKMNDDGTISMKVVDYYDFTKLKGDDIFDKLNNNAYKQQKLGKLKPYVLYFELTY